MRNDPRGQERLRGIRIRNTASIGCTTTDLLRGLTVGRRKRVTMAVAPIMVATIILGGTEPLLSSHGFQPLHSGPVQAFSRPSIAAPSLLALSRCQFSDMA